VNGITLAVFLVLLLIVGGYALAGSPEVEEVERDD
jgi:hypothetical protein